MTSGPDGASHARGDVTIRYWASARAAAGRDSDCFAGRYVGDVLEAAAAAHTGLGAILEVSTILMDGRPMTAAEPLPASSPGSPSEGTAQETTLEVLPPFTGG